ncbi:Cytochrome c oxidase subunit 6b-2, partial [Camellia lanceoleosa]
TRSVAVMIDGSKGKGFTRHCFTHYIEFHRCLAAKGEESSECQRFAKYYRSLCLGPDNLDNLRKPGRAACKVHRVRTLWLVRPLKQLQRRET